MQDDLFPGLSSKSLRVLKILQELNGDIDAALKLHPELTFNDFKEAATEAVGMLLSPAAKTPVKASKPSAWKRAAKQTYQIKITLRGSKPPIWRRVLVPGHITLADFHDIIQTAMGWTDSHLHMFNIGDQSFSMPDSDSPRDELDERKYRLCDVVHAERTKFTYWYDFGDDWHHDLLIEKITPGNAELQCLAGKRRCPPEDCGGIWGYQHLLEVLADPKDEEYEDKLDWLGGPIDPEAFNLQDINEQLKQIKC